MKIRWSISPCAAAALMLVVGCNRSQNATGPARSPESSLKQISVLYGQYTGRNRGQGPKNEAEFRKFITENGERSLKMAAVSSVDELFTSSRDNEPFVIRYGIKPSAPGKSGGSIIAYEKSGSGGSRFAVDSVGAVKTVDQSELDELLKK
jgi:hypothetical protein